MQLGTIRRGGEMGHILRNRRKALGLSQTALGARIGLSQERISAIERKPESVALDQLLDLMMALGCELAVQTREPTPPSIW